MTLTPPSTAGSPAAGITEIDYDTRFRYGIVRPDDRLDDSRLVRLVVDSRARNRSAFPSPSAYEVELPYDLHNVTFAKLVASRIPFVAYTIGESNNALQFATAGSETLVREAKIEPGDYADGEALAAAVEAAMNAAVGGTEAFRVTYSNRTDNFTIAGTRFFQLALGQQQEVYNSTLAPQPPRNSIGAVLGFGSAVYAAGFDAASTSVYRHVVKSPFRMNLGASNDAAVVSIDQFDLNVSPLSALHGSFAIIGKPADGCAVAAQDHDHEQFCRCFSPPLGRLSKLRVALTDLEGKPFDAQNQDHRLEFILVVSSRQRS